MDKNKRFAKKDLGLEVVYVNGATSVTREEQCTTTVDMAAIQAKKLYALTHMMTGNGWAAFEDLVTEDQCSVMELIRDLSAEVAALTGAAQEIELDDIRAAGLRVA